LDFVELGATDLKPAFAVGTPGIKKLFTIDLGTMENTVTNVDLAVLKIVWWIL
jgi:hypothetical protein